MSGITTCRHAVESSGLIIGKFFHTLRIGGFECSDEDWSASMSGIMI